MNLVFEKLQRMRIFLKSGFLRIPYCLYYRLGFLQKQFQRAVRCRQLKGFAKSGYTRIQLTRTTASWDGSKTGSVQVQVNAPGRLRCSIKDAARPFGQTYFACFLASLSRAFAFLSLASRKSAFEQCSSAFSYCPLKIAVIASLFRKTMLSGSRSDAD